MQRHQHLWSLLRRSTIWVIWIRRNAHIFTTTRWSTVKLESTLWDVFLDLARTAWQKVQEKRITRPASYRRALAQFDQTWCSSATFLTRQDDNVRWHYIRPLRGTFR